MRCYITLMLYVLYLLGGNAPAAEPVQFRVRAHVLEAIEGGPVLIKATLSYHGTEKIRICQTFIPNARIQSPKGWKEVLMASRETLYLPEGKLGGYAELAPEGERSEILVLHYDHVIPPGKVSVKLTWSISGKDQQGQPIAPPSTTVVVDVLPASAENLNALRNRLIERVKQPASMEVSPDRLADMILFTKHRALLPAAWAMIETAPSKYPFGALFRHIYKLSQREDEVDARMVRLIPRLTRSAWMIYPFREWRERETILPPECLKRLMNDPNLWVRVLTCETFGAMCDKAWISSLLTELRQVARPLPEDQFAGLLAELDDDRFQHREKATTKMLQLALSVENQLAKCDQASLSLEAARRVRHILATIAERRPDSPAFRVFDYLDVEPPEAQTFAILRALSDGPADAWLTKEAKTRLSAKLKKRPSK